MSRISLSRLVSGMLAAALATTALTMSVAPAHAAPQKPGAPGLNLVLPDGLVKLTGKKAIQIGGASTDGAGIQASTTCYVSSPFGPQFGPGFTEMQVAFTMRCQFDDTGFPSTDVTSSYARGEIRYIDNRPFSARYDEIGTSAVSVVAAAPATIPGVFKGVVQFGVIYLGYFYFIDFETVRTLTIQ